MIMNHRALIQSLPSILLSALIGTAVAQPNLDSSSGTSSHPRVVIVIAVLSIIFSLCFLLLIFTKLIRCGDHQFINRDPNLRPGGTFRSQAQNPRCSSGIERTVVESLSLFRFSSLQGLREGLECSVCLSKFGDEEVLRLLPTCKHAFHLHCLDQWLESHSTCPLCRHRLDPNDANLFKYSNSSRCLFGINKDEISVQNENVDDEPLPKSKAHRITLSDVAFMGRWSDLNSCDLMSLNSGMLKAEINNTVSRFEGAKNIALNSDADDKVRSLWPSIALRTVQRFASGGERRECMSSREDSIV